MKLRAPIKGIFFDIGWTLSYPLNHDWLIIQKMRECADMNTYAAIPQDKKGAAFDRLQQYLDDHHLLMTEDEELRQFEAAYSMLAHDLPELDLNSEQIKAIAYSKTFDMDNYVLFDDTMTTLEALKGKYKLGVISDTWPSVERFLKHNGMDGYFDTKTFSCFLGTFKPDERMYRHALQQMGLPPEQTVFVDDSVVNLDGAVKCGIQAVLIAAKPNAERTDKYPSIKNLSKLLALLPE